ncbi:hypothetical protein Tdes44962_MAKER09859 [Teratosphaeria destructans]|uniref:Cyanovirin-N domain-containing protein n=1 Tax=Teratosphaeria destructans TaxID=418781 RepID=A0A9W7SR86_9PEZI|nr:hypothetical protein Tdes44962_MAKER09859 [Teratosphaeria destructans]
MAPLLTKTTTAVLLFLSPLLTHAIDIPPPPGAPMTCHCEPHDAASWSNTEDICHVLQLSGKRVRVWNHECKGTYSKGSGMDHDFWDGKCKQKDKSSRGKCWY